MKDTSEVDGAQHSSREIDLWGFGWYLETGEIVLRPAGDDDHLRVYRDLAQELVEPREPDTSVCTRWWSSTTALCSWYVQGRLRA